jgi:hypothetical protein
LRSPLSIIPAGILFRLFRNVHRPTPAWPPRRISQLLTKGEYPDFIFRFGTRFLHRRAHRKMPSPSSMPRSWMHLPTRRCLRFVRATSRLMLSRFSGSSRFNPVGPSSSAMTRPLRSTGITLLHHYYGAVRPSPAHRYFRPRGWSRLRLFPRHRRPGSHVPHKSQIELRAAYMPDAAWAVSVHPPSLSRKMGLIRFRHFCSGSLALASLNHTCRNLVPPFSQLSPPWLLTTAACGVVGAISSRVRKTNCTLLKAVARL